MKDELYEELGVAIEINEILVKTLSDIKEKLENIEEENITSFLESEKLTLDINDNNIIDSEIKASEVLNEFINNIITNIKTSKT